MPVVECIRVKPVAHSFRGGAWLRHVTHRGPPRADGHTQRTHPNSGVAFRARGTAMQHLRAVATAE